jgi:hypothetical protein
MNDWIAVHVHYHDPLDPAVAGLVAPVFRALWADGLADRFFFVRHGLGGPHLRLRLRPRAGAAEAVRDRVDGEVGRFLAVSPSTRSIDPDLLAQRTREIAAEDPHEDDEAVYGNNTWRWLPFRPEVERYGGPSLLPHSLDLFAVSSLEAFRFVAGPAVSDRGRRLTAALRLLLRQAFAQARTADELRSFAGYALGEYSERFSSVAAKARTVYEQQREDLAGIFVGEARRRLGPAPGDLAAAARALSAVTLGHPRRSGILGSQLHMTANRLGLLTPEEVYLAVLAASALDDALEREPQLAADLEQRLDEDAEAETAEGLDRLVRSAAERFVRG